MDTLIENVDIDDEVLSDPGVPVIESESASTRVYVGPTIPGLAKFTVFRGSKPAHVVEMEADFPELSELIVPVDMLHDADSEAGTSGTMLHIVAGTVREHFSNRR